MMQTSKPLVGNSFKLGYRFQRYWDTSMAIAFFSAEVGAGLFLVSFFLDYVPGMIVGLLIAGTLKPYFHLAHMGVPQKSWRAILRPDRSWISRGALAVALMIGCGVVYLLERTYGVGSAVGLGPAVMTAVGYGAVIGALVVVFYQGLAMAHSESFTLWANPLVPLSSGCYAFTAGSLLALVIGAQSISAEHLGMLRGFSVILLLIDVCVIAGILVLARNKSPGGAFSVSLLLNGEYASLFRYVVIFLGLLVPLVLLLVSQHFVAVLFAALSMLSGFFCYRVLIFKAAVFEPITHDLAGSIGLPRTS
ncbi:MAG: hypothetical protein IPP18_01600 [Rhodocyclaceae bacterium]|jgi:DMSO reductase anchor subunit|nr:hypothetical protein [Rhodocyclaceae bacterium]MBK9311023.1 hypothetical protein [Rhodocyclaceae bacterium]MBK9953861.1 hypothetical protein [Rhodocyclaceae bacterium]